MKKTTAIILIFWSFLSIQGFGQRIRPFQEKPDKSLTEIKELAITLFETAHYYESLNFFKQLEQIDSLADFARYHQAEAYYHLRDYERSMDYFNQISADHNKAFEWTEFRIAELFQAMGRPSRAIEQYEKFINSKGKNKQLTELAQQRILFLRSGSGDIDGAVKIERVAVELAETGQVFGGFMSSDSLLYVTKVQPVSGKKTEINDTKGKYDTVFVNRIFTVDEEGKGSMLDMSVEDKHSSIGSPVLSSDGSIMVFTMCGNEDNPEQCQVFYSQRNNKSKWTTPEAFSAINTPTFSSKQPAIFKSDKGWLLLYASNKPGGEGGYDLWLAYLNGELKVMSDEPLGKQINTPFDEFSPWFDMKSNYLFFSSNGYPGYGQQDIYLVGWEHEKQQGGVHNLGKQINSTVDDYYFRINPNNRSALMSSNRGVGANLCCDNLFRIDFEHEFSYAELPTYTTQVSGFEASDAAFKLFQETFEYALLPGDSSTLDGLMTADVTMNGSLMNGEKPVGGTLVYLLDQQGNIIDSTYTDENGKFSFRQLSGSEDYVVMFDTEDAGFQAAFLLSNDQDEVFVDANSAENAAFFRYRKLNDDSSKAGSLATSDVTMQGQLLFNDQPSAGINVVLLDQNGSPLDSALTDETGRFNFKKLNGSEQYMLLFDTEDTGHFGSFSLVNREGEKLSSKNSMDHQAFFMFRKLHVDSEDSGPIAAEDVNISGNLSFQGKPVSDYQLALEDLEGNTMAKAISDEQGYFEFRRLPGDREYVLVLNAGDAEMEATLTFKKQDGTVIKTYHSGKDKRFFRYKSLADEKSNVALIANEDGTIFQDADSWLDQLTYIMTSDQYQKLESQQPTNIANLLDIRVQIGAYRFPSDDLFNEMHDIPSIEEEFVNEMTKFLIGHFKTLNQAEVLRKKAFEQGVDDAFIAIYYDGERKTCIYY